MFLFLRNPIFDDFGQTPLFLTRLVAQSFHGLVVQIREAPSNHIVRRQHDLIIDYSTRRVVVRIWVVVDEDFLEFAVRP